MADEVQRKEGPTPSECRQVVKALAKIHGMPARTPLQQDGRSPYAACGESQSVVEALVRTMLSQNTTQKNSDAAMRQLMETFAGDWGAIRRARPERIARAIACGGLANVKSKRIHRLLVDLEKRFGTISLESLRDARDEDAMQTLLQVEGVGPKTAACVMLFCLRRNQFAVDTHVLRISKKLGWLRPGASADEAHRILDRSIPNDLKYPLHVLLVEHGRRCMICAANGRPQFVPKGPCPLVFPTVPQMPRAKRRLKRTSPMPMLQEV